MGNVPVSKLVGKGKENKLTKFQRQKLRYDFDTFFGKYIVLSICLFLQILPYPLRFNAKIIILSGVGENKSVLF